MNIDICHKDEEDHESQTECASDEEIDKWL